MSAVLPGRVAGRHALLAAAIVLVVGGVVSATFVSRTSDLDVARELIADENAFAAASTAGAALNRASIHLQKQGDDCENRCDRFFTAAAMARTSAVVALRCKRPQLHEIRIEFVRYLDALASGGAPDPPFPPAC